jgi:hypothetical protein
MNHEHKLFPRRRDKALAVILSGALAVSLANELTGSDEPGRCDTTLTEPISWVTCPVTNIKDDIIAGINRFAGIELVDGQTETQ